METDEPKCGYCGHKTHSRDICPHEAFDKATPEYERLKANVINDNNAQRYGHGTKYRPK